MLIRVEKKCDFHCNMCTNTITSLHRESRWIIDFNSHYRGNCANCVIAQITPFTSAFQPGAGFICSVCNVPGGEARIVEIKKAFDIWDVCKEIIRRNSSTSTSMPTKEHFLERVPLVDERVIDRIISVASNWNHFCNCMADNHIVLIANDKMARISFDTFGQMVKDMEITF